MNNLEISLLVLLIVAILSLIFVTYLYLTQKNLKESLLIKAKELQQNVSSLESENLILTQKLNFLENSKKEQEEHFNLLANKILQQNSKEFSNLSSQKIETLLKPLNNQINEFKTKLEQLSLQEAKEISALFNELKNLKELNEKLSNQAQNLTNALKGDNKKQGIWGEMILNKVLELSGLKEGIEYKKEFSIKNYRPDVVVFLPNNKKVIIDAKTSLKAYSNYIATSNKEYLKEHINSIKRHINDISNKNYEELIKEGLDFILLFIPIDSALALAQEEDTELFEFAFKKRVILTSPSTLLASLRAIESSWRVKNQEQNIKKVIDDANILYNKVRGFIEDFTKVGKSLQNAQNSYNDAFNKLSSGKGNILKIIKNIKENAEIKPKIEIEDILKD